MRKGRNQKRALSTALIASMALHLGVGYFFLSSRPFAPDEIVPTEILIVEILPSNLQSPSDSKETEPQSPNRTNKESSKKA